MNYAELSTQYGFPVYRDMVKAMAKPMGGPKADMLHMAVGMSGEAAELMGADSRKNLMEELGDMEFYFEGMTVCIENGYQGAFNVDDRRNKHICLGNVFFHIQTLTGDILDLSKKPWVYNERDPKYLDLLDMMHTLRGNLNYLHGLFGTTLEEVRFGNQVKLKGTPDQKGRYASGVYSDEQAQARADKA